MFYFGLLMRVGLTAGANQLSRVVSSEEGGLRLSEQPSINWKTMACPNASSVELLDTKLQTIGGFGASMTESSAINLNALLTPFLDHLGDPLFSNPIPYRKDGLYHVVYEDGDAEDLDQEELDEVGGLFVKI